MNESERFLFQKVLDLCGIHGILLDVKNRIVFGTYGEKAAPQNEILAGFRTELRTCGVPALHFIEDTLYYMGFLDSQERMFLFGPISCVFLSEEQERNIRMRRLGKAELTIPCIHPDRAASLLTAFYAFASGRFIRDDEVAGLETEEAKEISGTDVWKHFLDGEDLSIEGADQFFLKELRQGRMHIDEKLIRSGYREIEQIGPLGLQNYTKQLEYMVVRMLYVASSCAAEQGIPQNLCWRLYDEYIMKLSKCTGIWDMLRVYAAGINDFNGRIAAQKESPRKNDFIGRCESYIMSHLKEKISLGDLAEHLGYNPSYISRKFSEQKGMTIQEYVIQEKLKLAANLLKNSNEPVRRISEYLGFYSQSYFASRFAKQYGMNPMEYRNQEKDERFLEEK